MTRQIETKGARHHNKAAETYEDVVFKYDDGTILEISVPVVYRRTGLDLEHPDEIYAHIETVYDQLHPENWDDWKAQQASFWKGSKADVTKPFFDVLAKELRWVAGGELPPNKNPARRLQDIKEAGYTIATRNKGRDYEYILLPIPRGNETGYEYWSGRLRARIMSLLGHYDAFEGRSGNPKHLLPDHKFPEIRWDRDTARESLEDLSDADIRDDFQLINNQRNQQKREACRGCRRTAARPYPMGIRFYYAGESAGPPRFPPAGRLPKPAASAAAGTTSKPGVRPSSPRRQAVPEPSRARA